MPYYYAFTIKQLKIDTVLEEGIAIKFHPI